MELGRNISTGKDFTITPEYAKNIGCTFFQIFLGSPRQVICKKHKIIDLKLFSSLLKKNNIRMVIHSSYTINLAHPINSVRFNASIKSLTRDLISSAIIGKMCIGVVVHMGKNIISNNIDNDDAIKNYIYGIKECLKNTEDMSIIILETGASQGREIASYNSGLAEIFENLSEKEKKRVRFCIDTCHIWASGYDISTISGMKVYLKDFDNKIGLRYVSCIHLNDSKSELNSCVDRHADISYGKIGIKGLKYLVKWATKHNIPIVLETPLDSVNKKTNKNITHEEQMKMVLSWVNVV